MSATTLSTRGQIVIPKELREARNWLPGMSLEVEEWPQGLLIRPASLKLFAASSVESVMGSTGYQGPAFTEDEIAQALDSDIQHMNGGR